MKYKFIILSILIIFCFASYTKKVHSISNQSFKIDKINDFISHQMDSLKIPAVSFAMINNSKIVYHATFGVKSINTNEAITANSLFDAGSLTKTVFAYLVMRTVDKNQLDLDTPLYQYLPNKDIEHDERYKKITARMVLSHSSGFPNWRRFNKDGKLDIKFTPGTDFNYSGEGYEYLADVLAKINNMPKDSLELLMKKEIYTPLEMQNSATIWSERVQKQRIEGHIKEKVGMGWGISAQNPHFYAAYSLQSEALDYAKLLVAIMSGEGLSEKSKQEMLSVQIQSNDKTKNWGLGIEIEKMNDGKLLYKHGGFNNNFSSGYLFSADSKNGYVFFANSDSGYKLNEIFEKYRGFLMKL